MRGEGGRADGRIAYRRIYVLPAFSGELADLGEKGGLSERPRVETSRRAKAFRRPYRKRKGPQLSTYDPETRAIFFFFFSSKRTGRHLG